jgi:hypothetical protein
MAVVAAAAAALLAWCGPGCSTPTGPGVHVQVRAEPKQGYHPPIGAADTGGYGATVEASGAREATPPGFDLIDYQWLAGIVTFVEPVGGAAGPPTTATGEPLAPLNATVDARHDASRHLADVRVASVGGRVVIRGVSRDGPAYVVRTEDGAVTEVDPADPVYVPARPGPLEILRDDRDEPIARVYVAPTPWARRMRGGERVTFRPLPPGTYTVTAWHPILPGSSRRVEVTPGPLVKTTLTVGVNALPKAGAR